MKILYVVDDPRDTDLLQKELTRQAPGITMDVFPTLGLAWPWICATGKQKVILSALQR